ncbi:MAG: hypothetical protein IJU23_01225 [Proteobacteria bacterium]|nr:hypothetical protein [Pseudomonadota bacterium]
MTNTKKCKYCKEEIDAKATKCPHCQENQPNGCFRLIVGGFFIFLLFCFIIPVCARKSLDDNTSTSGSSSSQVVKAPSYSWVYQQDKDDFDGKESKYCQVKAENSIKGVVWTETPKLLVRLRGKELDVIVKAEGVVFGNLGDSDKVRLKFDDEEPFSVGYNGSANGDGGTIFLKRTSKIIENLKKSKKLVVEFPVYMEQPQRATFNIDGYSEVCKI